MTAQTGQKTPQGIAVPVRRRPALVVFAALIARTPYGVSFFHPTFLAIGSAWSSSAGAPRTIGAA
jgi:hypothetical protein